MSQTFEEKCREFLLETTEKTRDRLYGLMDPHFAACSEEEPSLTVSYEAKAWELNVNGAMHGGITVAMMDSAMGTLGHVVTGKVTPTINLNTSFLRAGPSEGRVFVKARLTKRGRTVLYFSGEAWDEKAPGKLIATAEGVFRNFGE